MRRTGRIFKFHAKAATTSLFLVTAAGAATLSAKTQNPKFTLFSDDSLLTSAAFSDVIRAGLSGVARSSRAIWTVRLLSLSFPDSLLHCTNIDSFGCVILCSFLVCVWSQITSTVVDYKYSLHGLSEDSEDYRRVLSEVRAIFLFQ